MDQHLVREVAAVVKAAGQDVEGAVAQLFADHGANSTILVLQHLSQEVQVQLSERLAEWTDYKATHRPREEFLSEQAGYLSWKASASRYRDGINNALRAAKQLRKQLIESRSLPKGPGKREAKAEVEGYVAGARVAHAVGGGDVGTVIEAQGRSVWIVWDSAPDLPIQYASPWYFSVIESLEKEEE